MSKMSIIELSQLGQDILTHRSTEPPIHPPIGGGLSANHKSSNSIELSRLGPDLFDF